MKTPIELPLENKHIKGNYFGHKVCYDCGQVYDARFDCCINCGYDVWDNLRSYKNKDGKIIINEIEEKTPLQPSGSKEKKG